MDAAAWDERYRDQEVVWTLGPNQFVAAEVADLPPGRALDLAAGEGRNALHLARLGWEVEAVEFSQVAIDKGREWAQREGVEVAWTLADLTASPRLEPADLVLLVYLHLPEPDASRIRREAAALVRPGGVLLEVAHARRNLVDGVGGPPDPSLLPEPDDVAETLAGAGLEVERAEEVTRAVEGEEREAIDVLVRARRPA